MNKADPWFVYLIVCKNKSIYTGITTNVQRRFMEHQNQGKKCAKYLRGKSPLTLVFQKCFNSKSEALRMEHLIKKLSRMEKDEIIKKQSLPPMMLDHDKVTK